MTPELDAQMWIYLPRNPGAGERGKISENTYCLIGPVFEVTWWSNDFEPEGLPSSSYH